ncbi:MAG TPA: hypothetical protein VMS89_07000 [Methanoregulaceae archaeon]|nr:hypothetical protein [Methanoregulaceae archaeon]
MLLLVSLAGAQTLSVSVFEKDGTINPVPYASVFVNGALAGKTGTDGIFTFTHPGTDALDVKVLKPGYESWEDQVGKAETGVLVQIRKKQLSLTMSIFDTDSALPVPNTVVKLSGVNITGQTNQTDTTGKVVFPVVAEGVYTITIDAPNYQERTAVVEMGTEDKTVQYLLLRSDRFSILVYDGRDQSPAAGAEVFIDGVSKGKTDQNGILTLEIPRNKVYNLKIVKSGFVDYLEKRNIGENEAVVNIPLSVAPYKASITVFNEMNAPVEGAAILVNGNPVGTTSQFGKYSFQNPLAEDDLLEIRHSGYTTVRKDVARDDVGKDLTVILPAAVADLTVYVEDEGHVILPNTTVFLNGQNSGMTDGNGMLIVPVKVNVQNNITAAREGYQPATVTKTLDPANTKASSITITLVRGLNPILIPAVTGSLIVVILIIAIILTIRSRRRRPGKTHSVPKSHADSGGGRRGGDI